MKIDTAVMTYNSAGFLEESLTSLEKAVPINRLIVIDHYSKDNTLEIARRHNAEIYQENIGLGYARQLAISKIGTPVFYFHDSDVIYRPPFNWSQSCIRELLNKKELASIVARVGPRISYNGYPSARAKYVQFWWKHVPAMERFPFVTGSTFIKLETVEDINIPIRLDAREDKFIEMHILRKGLKVKYIRVNGLHPFIYSSGKEHWIGANQRLLSGIRTLPYLLVRRVLTAPLKAIPPMLFYKDISILSWNTRRWLNYLQGYLNPNKYRKLKRVTLTS